MWRHPDGTFRVNLPPKVRHGDYIVPSRSLSREQLASLGYHEAIPLKREPFTRYTTEWQLGDDLIYREVALSQNVDNVAKEAAKADKVRTERDRRIQAVMWRVQRWEAQNRMGLSPVDDIAALDSYVQALRDLPEQAGFPHDVVWPTVPEEPVVEQPTEGAA
ncbi:phage tail assembly chaperone [Desulfovibrio oxyclinae]|uniref:phage tail assembly chaperone n=1 Tax=Desulfovibrio oxyclinae TaxID=63560 RepID=UPI00037393A1|nr:phage tail assembly chaperone [Desulfovibrio oxyclinae]